MIVELLTTLWPLSNESFEAVAMIHTTSIDSNIAIVQFMEGLRVKCNLPAKSYYRTTKDVKRAFRQLSRGRAQAGLAVIGA